MESKRLNFREARDSDAQFIKALMNDPDWLRYIGDRNLDSISKARVFIRQHLQNPATNNGLGMYVIELKPDLRTIGLAGLLHRDHMPDIDIGYALLPDARGFGYAEESIRFFVKHAFVQLLHSTLYAIVHKDNVRSISLIKRCGFHESRQPFTSNTEGALLYFLRKK